MWTSCRIRKLLPKKINSTTCSIDLSPTLGDALIKELAIREQ